MNYIVNTDYRFRPTTGTNGNEQWGEEASVCVECKDENNNQEKNCSPRKRLATVGYELFDRKRQVQECAMVGKGEPVCFKLMVARGDGGGGCGSGREVVCGKEAMPCMLPDLT